MVEYRAVATRISQRHRGKSVWPFAAFMALFAGLLLLISNLYLIPALKAYSNANAKQRELLSMHAMLLLCSVLILLGLFLILLFRFGRSIYRAPEARQKPTTYVDAWTEAGKRLKTPKDDI